MSKILLYTIDFSPNRGGIARHLSALSEYFGSELKVVVPDAEHRRWWSAAMDLIQRRLTYETLLISHVLPLGTAAMLAGVCSHKPYVVLVHGMDIGLAKRNFLKRFVSGFVLRAAKCVVANSRALEREVRDSFGVRRTLVVYPCVSEKTLSLSEARSSHRESRPFEPVTLLTVSRLVPRKGHLRVLEAIDGLRARYPDLRIAYTIVGDGPMHAAIENDIRERALPDVNVVMNATDEELASFYSSADIFVMPVIRDNTDREGFGTVYLEAAAYGVPSIATDMPGVDEAVIQGVTGILIPDGDGGALADAIYRLARDPAGRLELGNAARSRVVDQFTPKKQFIKLTDIM